MASELEAYKEQLFALSEELDKATSEEVIERLTVTRDELIELIVLMEDELRQGSQGVGTEINQDSVQDAAESDEQDEEDFSLLVGHRCFAPCPLAEGMGVARHAAIVMDVEGFDGQTGLMVSVLYSHPLTNAMRACPHFLSDSCKYGEKCRFSHGCLVAADALEEYEEPDFSKIEIGSAVLLSIDPLWEVGRVTAMDGNELAVKILRTGAEVQKGMDGVVPLGDCEIEEEEPEASSSWEELKGERLGRVNVADHGSWEGGGIGMALMRKMGYKEGEGLGKKSNGIIHAIQARICPKRVSLDVLMHRKKKFIDGIEDPFKKNTQPGKSEATIFAFINRKLEEKGKKSEEEEKQERKAEEKALMESSQKTLGAQATDVQRKMKDLKGKQKKLEEGIRRNVRDKQTLQRLQNGLEGVKREMAVLERKEGVIARAIDAKGSRKKDIF